MKNEPFTIFELTKEMSENFLKGTFKPHRHDWEELIIVTSGNPCHFIDFTRTQLQPPVAVYVAKGKIHSFIPDENTRGWVIQYNDFIPQSRFNFYSNFTDNINFHLGTECDFQLLNTLCMMMLKEYQQAPPEFPVIKHLLSALLAKLESDSNKELFNPKPTANAQLITFNNFLKILESNFRRPEGVEFYADKLNMTARNLNNISQAIFGSGVKEIIETRKMIEARNLLLNSDKTISEIGFELGYNEKSYFSRVFHKRTGLTPTEFKEQMCKVIS
jgi:AraC family transcriptional activator of pobA